MEIQLNFVPRKMTISAWYMDASDEDQRLPHKLEDNEPVTESFLHSLGVLTWSKITGEGYSIYFVDFNVFEHFVQLSDDPNLAAIKLERNYNYTDIIHVCPEKLPEYEKKIQSFFREHIHYDEEIRYCMDGSGYFDVRDGQDRWIRIAVEAGDMIVLPEGIYHRFTVDSNNYIKAMVSLLSRHDNCPID